MEPHRAMNFKAENRATLLDILRSIDIVGPLKNNCRKKHATEPYALAHLLSSLAEEDDLLTFPLELIHNDKPDFLLSMPEKKIGIEHTDARPESETRKANIRIRHKIGPSLSFVTPVEPDERKRSARQLRQEIKANDPGAGWANQDNTDRKWAEVMLSVIGDKEHKLRAPEFSRYDEDWLLIRDAWPVPSINPENATEHLFSQILNRNAKLEFHRVFIVSYSDRGPICDVAESGFHLHPRSDLWVKLL